MEIITMKGHDDLEQNFESLIAGKAYAEIDLPVPVINPALWESVTKPLCMLLTGLSEDDIEQVARYAKYLMDDRALSDAEAAQLADEAQDAPMPDGNNMGGAAIAKCLERLTNLVILKNTKEYRDRERALMKRLEKLKEDLAEIRKVEDSSDNDGLPDVEDAGSCQPSDVQQTKAAELVKEISAARSDLKGVRRMLDALMYAESGTKGLVISKISVFPHNVRSILHRERDHTPYAVLDDLAILYSHVLSRCERVRMVEAMGAPEIILRNERRILGEAVSNVYANGKDTAPVCGADGQPLSCLRDILCRAIM